MERVSDERLSELIGWYSIFPESEDHEKGLHAALTELRERRAAEADAIKKYDDWARERD